MVELRCRRSRTVHLTEIPERTVLRVAELGVQVEG